MHTQVLDDSRPVAMVMKRLGLGSVCSGSVRSLQHLLNGLDAVCVCVCVVAVVVGVTVCSLIFGRIKSSSKSASRNWVTTRSATKH